MSKTLFAGPWVGEFGWELFQFQGHIRAKAKYFDRVIVSSRSGHEFLYEDFMTSFVPYDPPGIHTECEQLMGHTWDSALLNKVFVEHKATTWLKGSDTTRNNASGQWAPTYIQYGNRKDTPKTIDIVIHARQARKRGDMQAYRNWTQEYLEELVRLLPTQDIAFIGKTGDCGYVEGYADYRDRPLRELSELFDKSKILLGPSSGPMHFGSLCGIPHIVTFGIKDGAIDNYDRYTTLWNPLDTPVLPIRNGWSPDPKLIIEKVNLWL